MARFDYENRVRIFLLFSHEQLIADLAKGGGESLTSLCALLDLNKTKQEAAILELARLAAVVKDTPAFAEAVLMKFRNG